MDKKSLYDLIPKDIVEKYNIDSIDFDGKIPIISSKSKANKEMKDVLSSIFGEDLRINTKKIKADSTIEDLIDQIIKESIIQRASDIHFEPKKDKIIIRFRIDGILQIYSSISKSIYLNAISYLKIKSRLDITEKRMPQEGGHSLFFDGKNYDIRLSTIPTLYGEKVALRILPTDKILNSIEDLGIRKNDGGILKNFFKKKNGAVVISGPTGSGKSTTLHILLNYIGKDERNVMTIEDPIEIIDENFNQIQVNEDIGLTYPLLLKKILRQDPDVVLIGEIRDSETAKISCEAALTGHLILTTIHTKNCESIILRLLEMGLEPYLISSSLDILISQRLLRKVCDNCKEEEELPENLLNQYGIKRNYIGKGCLNCNYTGYYGRIGVFEIIQLSEKTKKLILHPDSTEEIVKSIRDDCKTNLKSNIIELVNNGISNINEMLRVIE